MTTSAGTVKWVGADPAAHPTRYSIGLNDQGQVAVSSQLNGDSAAADAIFLLTPG